MQLSGPAHSTQACPARTNARSRGDLLSKKKKKKKKSRDLYRTVLNLNLPAGSSSLCRRSELYKPTTTGLRRKHARQVQNPMLLLAQRRQHVNSPNRHRQFVTSTPAGKIDDGSDSVQRHPGQAGGYVAQACSFCFSVRPLPTTLSTMAFVCNDRSSMFFMARVIGFAACVRACMCRCSWGTWAPGRPASWSGSPRGSTTSARSRPSGRPSSRRRCP